MTLFNEINARKIHGQRNVFRGFFSNWIYYTIWIGTFLSQILIIEVGGVAFSTTKLNAEQWIWCIFFGLGVLLWQQVVTTVPTSLFGGKIEVGANPPESLNSPNLDGDPISSYTGHSHHRDSHNPIQTRSGQILWIRGLTRLQTQIRVVNAFRHGVDSDQLKQATSNPNIQRVLQKQVSLSNKRMSVASSSYNTDAASAVQHQMEHQQPQSMPPQLQQAPQQPSTQQQMSFPHKQQQG